MDATTTVVELPPRLFPSAGYYLAMARADSVIIDASARYDKRQKDVHRFDIIDARGLLKLTVPLAKPHGIGFPTWNDCPVSTHDDWWRKHLTALESAYGRTPYFEFLIDKFCNVFRSPEQWDHWPSAIDLIREANRVVCSILSIDVPICYGAAARPAIVPDSYIGPYWQVRQHLFGFKGGLSVLDLLFNLGPEASLLLRSQLTTSS